MSLKPVPYSFPELADPNITDIPAGLYPLYNMLYWTKLCMVLRKPWLSKRFLKLCGDLSQSNGKNRMNNGRSVFNLLFHDSSSNNILYKLSHTFNIDTSQLEEFVYSETLLLSRQFLDATRSCSVTNLNGCISYADSMQFSSKARADEEVLSLYYLLSSAADGSKARTTSMDPDMQKRLLLGNIFIMMLLLTIVFMLFTTAL